MALVSHGKKETMFMTRGFIVLILLFIMITVWFTNIPTFKINP